MLMTTTVTACCGKEETAEYDWTQDSTWYHPNGSTVNDDAIDLFYIVSTEVGTAVNADGTISYRAMLTAEDKNYMNQEFAYVNENISHGDFNFFAPYYHQFTFDAVSLTEAQFDSVYSMVVPEVYSAFEYYMHNLNHGRRFCLMGFSQGGMLVLDLLKHMSAEEYRQMVAAYVLGYRLSEQDTICTYIRPAHDEGTCGVTVSFNSSLTKEGIWPLVSANAVTSINPVNWATDSTAATFTFNGHQHMAHIDAETHQILISTDIADSYREWMKTSLFQSIGVSPDCLHRWDLLFYTDFLHDNILLRNSSTNQ